MRWQAPAKINISLHVSPPRRDGLHPLESIVQTINWLDELEVELGEEGEDQLDSDIEDNIILEALRNLRSLVAVPPLVLTLDKTIPTEAGLGGGSSDAAAVLAAARRLADVEMSSIVDAAKRTGADVPLFLEGGTLMMGGIGEQIDRLEPLAGFAFGVVVPDFGLSTADVYRRWDEMEGPVGEEIRETALPPQLRGGMPIRNDLQPAAIDLEPRLGDFMADLRSVWATAVCLTGSGSACFGYFASVDEASDAVAATGGVGRGAEIRPTGVSPVQ